MLILGSPAYFREQATLHIWNPQQGGSSLWKSSLQGACEAPGDVSFAPPWSQPVLAPSGTSQRGAVRPSHADSGVFAPKAELGREGESTSLSPKFVSNGVHVSDAHELVIKTNERTTVRFLHNTSALTLANAHTV